jgi:CheY-like chemotaxis protein
MLVLKRLKFLIVDDHEDCRMLLTFILEAEGAEVTAATCATEAFAALQRSPFEHLRVPIVLSY